MKMHFYSQVLPTLQLFWNSRLPGVPMQHFRTPKFFFGNVNKNGEGVLVLEDIAATKGKVYCRYLKFFFHVLRKFTWSDFLKQISIRHILSFLGFFYTPQSLSTLPLIFSQLPKLEQPAPKRFVSMLRDYGM